VGLVRSLVERRGINDPTRPLTAANLSEWLGWSTKAKSGVSVNSDSAMRHSAVYRCVALISGGVAGLPLQTYRTGTRTPVTTDFLEDPHPDATPFELWEYGVWSLLLSKGSFMERINSGSGKLLELWPIHPDGVTVRRDKSSPRNPSGKVFEFTDREGTKREGTFRDVFHIPSPFGQSVISYARERIGLGLAAEEYASLFYGQGSLMSGILTADRPINETEAKTIKKRWRRQVSGLNKAHDIAVLGSGAKFQPISLSPSDAQWIESQKFSVNDIARFFGVPPHMVGDLERSTSWGSGIEHQSIGFVVYTLRPWLKRIEARVTKELLPGLDRYAKFTVEGLLRGDSRARALFYASGIQNGWLNRNEVRELEDREPADGLDEFLEPMNMTSDTIKGETDEG
jgi:HK97 family phage portal protein